jgi:hypothetical protein
MNVGEARTSSQRTKRTNKKSHQSVPNFNKANFFVRFSGWDSESLAPLINPEPKPKGPVSNNRLVENERAGITVGDQSVLHESFLSFEIGNARLKLRNVVKLTLTRLTSCKRVASSLDGDFVAWVDFNCRKRTLASAAVDSRRR